MGKTRTITLTGRRPVTIDESDWPIIARASGDNYPGMDPARHVQASQQGELDEYDIRVRQHADGRTIVYGTYEEGWHTQHEGLTHAGRLLPADEANGSNFAIADAIRDVGAVLGAPDQLVADAIADLPAEKL